MTEPLRICMVASYDLAEEGGVKKHTVHLARRLREMGDHVDIAGPSSIPTLPDGMRGFSGVVNIPLNGSDNHVAMFAKPWEVRRFLEDGRYDVIHVHAPEVPPLAWYFGWFGRASARVATFHAYTENEGTLSRLARRLVCGPQLRGFERGIAVSPSAAQFALGSWPRPLEIIPNGVDTQRFHPATSRAPGPVRLLFVGHWRDPRKGLPVLLDAFRVLKDRGTDVVLDVVGQGPEAQRVDLPGVTYLGAVNDELEIARRYRDCDVFVAPSMGMESFGIVLLEAMASGKPIACSDIDGYRAVVPHDGAMLVTPGDSLGLANAIDTLASSHELRRRMGDINRSEALQYDWTRLAERVREVYASALDRPRAGRRQTQEQRARA